MAIFRVKSAIPSLVTATGAICLFLVVLGMVAVESDPDETWSEWVQAIGSIAAIMTGWMFVVWEHEKAESARRDERRIFAAAFGIQLLPHLRKLQFNLEFTIESINDAIESTADPKSSVSYNDDRESHDNIKFVRANWSALAQLEAEAVRALVSASSYFEDAHSLYNQHDDVEEAFIAPDNSEWFRTTLADRERALKHRGSLELALKQVNLAIDNLSSVKSGPPERRIGASPCTEVGGS